MPIKLTTIKYIISMIIESNKINLMDSTVKRVSVRFFTICKDTMFRAFPILMAIRFRCKREVDKKLLS